MLLGSIYIIAKQAMNGRFGSGKQLTGNWYRASNHAFGYLVSICTFLTYLNIPTTTTTLYFHLAKLSHPIYK